MLINGQIFVCIMQLSTKRLIIREIEKSDLKEIVVNIGDIKVSRFLSVVPYPYRIKDAKFFLSYCTKSRRAKPRKTYDLVIALKPENKVIGGIGLMKVDAFNGTAEIGYWLGQKYWHNGIMSEAVAAMLDFAFRKLKLRRIDLHASTLNAGSNAIARKFGFKLEGMARKSVRTKATGKIHDCNMYGLLRSEWKPKKI
jgi:ribosomal-protein-alanine N-acetyltransferase